MAASIMGNFPKYQGRQGRARHGRRADADADASSSDDDDVNIHQARRAVRGVRGRGAARGRGAKGRAQQQLASDVDNADQRRQADVRRAALLAQSSAGPSGGPVVPDSFDDSNALLGQQAQRLARLGRRAGDAPPNSPESAMALFSDVINSLDITGLLQARERVNLAEGTSNAGLDAVGDLNDSLRKNLKSVLSNLARISKQRATAVSDFETCEGKLTEYKKRMATFKVNNQGLRKDLHIADKSLISAHSEISKLEVKSEVRQIKFDKLTKELAKVSAYKDQLDKKLHLINKNLGRIDSGISKQIGKIAGDNVLNDIRDVTTYMKNMTGGSSDAKRERIIMKKLKIQNNDILEVIKLFFKKELKRKSELIILATNIHVSIKDSKGKLLKVKQLHRRLTKALSGITGINKKYILSL